MADQYTGQWGTISFTIPDFLQDARDAVNDLATVLITALEIVNLALEFVKAFIKGFLDPIGSLLAALIEEIMAIIRDIRQIGLYITGDWALLGWPPEDLRGGFSGYERRMISRLADRSDPTRPDVSSKTKVLGFFGYISVDPTEIEKLINFILSMLRLFGIGYFPDTSRLPIPTIRDTLYGPDATSVFYFSSLAKGLATWDAAPQHCRVVWTVAPPTQKNPLNPFPSLGPSGYLVTVSTLPEGIQLRYARPKANTEKKDQDGNKDKKVQPREYGPVLDRNGQPVVLHGGAEMLSFKGSEFEYNKGTDSNGKLVDGACQVFGMLDPSANEIIPLELLGPLTDKLGEPGDGRGSEFLLQRTFLIESGEAFAQWWAGEYNTMLSLDDMPLAPEWASDGANIGVKVGTKKPASTYYVRVWSVGAEIADRKKLPQWDFNATEFATNVWKSGQPFIIDLKSGDAGIGMPSQPRKLTFATAYTKDYLHALETALLVLTLSRADLPLLDEIDQKSQVVLDGYKAGTWAGQQFATLATGLEDSRPVLRTLFPDLADMEKPGQSPAKWRADLFNRIRQIALDIYERTGPMPEAEKTVVQSTAKLRQVTWSDLIDQEDGYSAERYQDYLETTLGGDGTLPMFTALDPEVVGSRDLEFGLAPNIFSIGGASANADELFYAPPDGTATSMFVLREGEFTMWAGGAAEDITYEEENPVAVAGLTARASSGLKLIYEKFTDRDGKLLVPTEWRDYLEEMRSRAAGRLSSSGDFTPVMVLGASNLVGYKRDVPREAPWSKVMSMRALLRNTLNGQLYREAAIALRIATAAYTRPPADGEWLALRLFDVMPELENFLDALENWIRALAAAIQSMADQIVKYIEFLQAIIVDFQQLIRRINAMIQSLLAFSFSLPQFSGLMLLSNGTDGLMSDLVNATNKPSDSPLTYGGGLALVVPFGPAFIFDLIALAGGENPDPNKMTEVARPPDPIGIEQVEPAAGATPSDEPDVL